MTTVELDEITISCDCGNKIEAVDGYMPGFLEINHYIVTCSKCGKEYEETAKDILTVKSGGIVRRNWNKKEE
ncbi:MAG: hypothetical protein M3275_00080 [Thermoproteota archaeon]|nr:hypothetical protein [Thermoproteota archaeon]